MKNSGKTEFKTLFLKKLNRNGAAKTLGRPIPSVGGGKGGQA